MKKEKNALWGKAITCIIRKNCLKNENSHIFNT